MNERKRWLPGTRAGIAAMATKWMTLIGQNLVSWGIPAAEFADFSEVKLDADAAFAAAAGVNRTPGTVQAAREAQSALVSKMRYFKRRYFHVPPLTWEQWVLLGFEKPDDTKTTIPAPTDFAGVDVAKWGPHTLELRLFMQTNMDGNKESNYQVRVKYAPVQPGGSGTPTAARLDDGVFVLSAPPRTAEDLPNDILTGKTKYTLTLPLETAGMTCYLAAQYVSRGRKNGPLGDMIQTVIP